MKLEKLPTGAIDWSEVPVSEIAGESGIATVRARRLDDVQIRLVDYSAGYLADHWCAKGHIIFVAEGALTIEHQDGSRYELAAGSSYHVADDDGSPHRVRCGGGATVFIVD
ncbi:MAG TPA: DHCW motif cupin fold protein [Stellaceae bacterium]|nr:DHCW motif cupin fold protein [Stellaceae bacterium]